MSKLISNVQVSSFSSLTSVGGPYNTVIDNSSLDAVAISCSSAVTAGATLTLLGSVDGVNYVAIPSTIAPGNPVSLTSAATTIFNIAAGALAMKWLEVSLSLGGGNTMASFTVTVNLRNNSIMQS